MTDRASEVLALLERTDPIPRETVRNWAVLGDLRTRAAVYELTDKAWERITPELTGAEQCAFMAAYLLECIVSNPPSGDYLHSGFEAAWETAAWLKHLTSLPNSEQTIRQVAGALRDAYLRADETTRNRIETGALEHILESKSLRRYFKDWRDHPVLREAYERALSWGKAHPS